MVVVLLVTTNKTVHFNTISTTSMKAKESVGQVLVLLLALRDFRSLLSMMQFGKPGDCHHNLGAAIISFPAAYHPVTVAVDC